MKNKAPLKVKETMAKSNQTKPVPKQKNHNAEPESPASKALTPSSDPRFSQAVQNYEAGLRAMQAHKFDKAVAFLEKVVAGPSPELADRAGVHLNTCKQQAVRGEAASKFKSPEEHYDYAISLVNMGDYITAREHFDKLLKSHPTKDFVWYGAAVLECLTSHFPESLRALAESIRLNPANRFQARNDSDFNNLADDPRFTELLYPEAGYDGPSSTHF
jgi:tetratricopeptide (TPR) repeat protein